MNMAEKMRFRKMLTTLSKMMGDNELETMKYLSKEDIPAKRREEIKTILQFWEALEERELLAIDDLDHLKLLLESATEGRNDVMRVVEDFEQNDNLRLGIRETKHRKEPVTLTKEMEYVADNIGRNWKQLSRRLGLNETEIECVVENNIRNLKEQAWQSMKLWVEREQANATNEKLIKGLRQCQLNLTADNVEKMM